MTTPLTEITLPDDAVLWSVTKISDFTGVPRHTFVAYVGKGQAPAPSITSNAPAYGTRTPSKHGGPPVPARLDAPENRPKTSP